jgi:glycosyltransferase involved in cell wall biosynthesis
MSKGKAIIATAVGGIVDIIADGETGLLVPPGDAVALAEAMKRLIDNGETRDRLGRAAREHAKQFTADIIMPRFEKLYRELIDEAREGHQ